MGVNFIKTMLKHFTVLLGIISIFLLIGARTNHLMIVSGSSMYPTLKNGNLLVIDKNSNIKMGDIVIFKYNGENYVKRVAYTGDSYFYTIDNSDGITTYSLVSNNHPKAFKIFTKTNKVYTLKNKYWMWGDNYPMSVNSEIYGPITDANIIGKVMWVMRG